MTKVYGLRTTKEEKQPFHIELETGGLTEEQHGFLVVQLQAALSIYFRIYPSNRVVEEYTE